MYWKYTTLVQIFVTGIIHVQSWALGYIQIQGHNPIQNIIKIQNKIYVDPMKRENPKQGKDTHLNL